MDPMKTLMRVGVAGHVAMYRLTNGRVGATVQGSRVLLLTTRGRRSGKLRTTPLMRIEHDGAVHVVASAAGADRDPAWFRNLLADPRVRVRDRDAVWSARGIVLEGSDRDEVYAAAVADMGDFADYEARTERTIPVVCLQPLAAHDPDAAAM